MRTGKQPGLGTVHWTRCHAAPLPPLCCHWLNSAIVRWIAKKGGKKGIQLSVTSPALVTCRYLSAALYVRNRGERLAWFQSDGTERASASEEPWREGARISLPVIGNRPDTTGALIAAVRFRAFILSWQRQERCLSAACSQPACMMRARDASWPATCVFFSMQGKSAVISEFSRQPYGGGGRLGLERSGLLPDRWPEPL